VANKLSKVMGDYRDAAINSPAFEKTHPDAYQQIQLNRMLAERKYQQTQRKAVAE